MGPAVTPGIGMGALTIAKYIRFLLDDGPIDECPRWPPDVFAIAAGLLQRSGAYRLVIKQWPPSKSWSDDISVIGDDWREQAAENHPAPAAVTAFWNRVLAAGDVPVDEISEDLDLTHTLLQLSAAADEASADAGIFVGLNDAFSLSANRQLREKRGRTLCRDVDPSRAVVLPKLHTPQTGLTMRSLTHHLALYLAGQIRPQWHNLTAEQELTKVLILPWPLALDPKHFDISEGDPANMPGCYGYFSYELSYDSRGFMLDEAVKAIEAAKERVGRVDAVIFPELALRGDDYLELCTQTDTMIIAGVGTPPQGTKLATNSAAVAIPTGDMTLSWKQSKHHRWRLDEGQIQQYSFEDKFDPKKYWWEHIELSERSLHFLTLNNGVTMAVLICEDLARLDPVSELVMTVGPTFVVALLMDGPQLSMRWPGRYATVLADDPGSSVLSVTSLAMARAYRSKNFPASSVFALWKEAFAAPRQIEMKTPGAVGVVLRLETERKEEWTADGRRDYAETFYLRLTGEPEEIVL